MADRLKASDIALRRALGKRLTLIADALKDIEWEDSGDTGEGDSIPAIKAALAAPRIEELAELKKEVLTAVIELTTVLKGDKK